MKYTQHRKFIIQNRREKKQKKMEKKSASNELSRQKSAFFAY